MSISKKGKRRINVNGISYYWYVKRDPDYVSCTYGHTYKNFKQENEQIIPFKPIWNHVLRVTSTDQKFDKIWELDSDGFLNNPNSVTPTLVKQLIISII